MTVKLSAGKYEGLDPTEKWLANVSYANSGSKRTDMKYRRDFTQFLKFFGKTSKEIITEYQSLTNFSDALRFKDQIADVILSWIVHLREEGLANFTISCKVCSVKSFLKYNRIQIGYIPSAKGTIEYHNRDIKREEIATILNVSIPRDRAFYAIMAQSCLRPVTICMLQIKHIEYDRFLRGECPVKIDVPCKIAKGKYHSYFTFISEEAIHHLKSYLKTRNANKDSYLFIKTGSQNTPMKPSALSAQFNKTVRKLREKNVLDFELRYNKPSELRLYNLRKFFEKFAHKAGEEFSEFWMGHKIGVQDHYRATDPEHHRMQYAEKAAPDLSIQTNTPRATEKLLNDMNELKNVMEKKDQAIQELRNQNERLSARIDKLAEPLEILKEMDIEELSKDEERTPLGIIIQYLKLQAAKGLNDEIQKLKKPDKKEK